MQIESLSYFAHLQHLRSRHLDILDEILEVLLVARDVELLDHDGVRVLVAQPQKVGGFVGIPASGNIGIQCQTLDLKTLIKYT